MLGAPGLARPCSLGGYTVTAISHWVIDWAGGGATGQVEMTLVADTAIQIGETQAIVTS